MNKRKKSGFRRFLGVVATVFVALVVLAAILLVGARIAGLRVYTVLSGSMKPTYSEGDLIFVRKVSPKEIREGDPITFILNKDFTVATHRVVRVDAENERFYTKGDNNAIEDTNPVHFNNLIGKPVFRIPFVGFVSSWIQSPPGIYIALAVAIFLLGLAFIPELFRAPKNAEEVSASPGALLAMAAGVALLGLAFAPGRSSRNVPERPRGRKKARNDRGSKADKKEKKKNG